MFGIAPAAAYYSVRGMPSFLRDWARFRRLSAGSEWEFGSLYPCLGDRYADSGTVKSHYFHQDLLVARRIYAGSPARHMDVGSRIDGFVAHVASFRSIVVADIRPQDNNIPNVSFVRLDLMGEIPQEYVESCDSLSCLHALEHFGLGRYGDSIDPRGHEKGLDNLHRLLEPGGVLYLSVPSGSQRIEFNAHRVFAIETVLALCRDRFTVMDLSYVDDVGDLHESVWPDQGGGNSFGLRYGCGIFELRKL